LAIHQAEKGVAIIINDDGPGVPVEEQERIFKSFVTDKEGGTGLGLSISKKIVESYGGKISCSNNETGGASFKIYLPALK
jgi:signal transduction histidine kinase